jgi:BASS family bile acid:Na+ symporter
MLKTATNLGKGSASFMASIHLSFAALAFLTVPAVLYVISQPLGFHADVGLGNLLWTLGRTILIPVGLGLILRGVAPAFADKILTIVTRIGTIGLLITVVVVLAILVPTMFKMDAWSYLVIATVSVTAVLIGHLLGPADPSERTVLAVETGTRHPALAFAIGSMNFTVAKTLPVMGPVILTFIIIAVIYMAVRGKRTASVEPATSVS